MFVISIIEITQNAHEFVILLMLRDGCGIMPL